MTSNRENLGDLSQFIDGLLIARGIGFSSLSLTYVKL